MVDWHVTLMVLQDILGASYCGNVKAQKNIYRTPSFHAPFEG